jgi:hypothetical protein
VRGHACPSEALGAKEGPLDKNIYFGIFKLFHQRKEYAMHWMARAIGTAGVWAGVVGVAFATRGDSEGHQVIAQVIAVFLIGICASIVTIAVWSAQHDGSS